MSRPQPRPRKPVTKRTGPKYPGTGGFTSQGQKTCPVCKRRYPGSLGHACPGPPR